MDENVVFKTAAVGGFEKRAVLDYIYKSNEQTEEERAKLKEQILELEEKLQGTEENSRSINNNLRTIERDLSTLSNELADEKSARLELVAKNEELRSEIAHQKELVSKKNLETTAFMEKNQDIIQQNQSLEEQQKEIDKASYQLGRVMLDARTDADNIVSNAKEQAAELLAQAQADVAELQRKTQQETSGLLASTQEQIKSDLDAAKSQGERTKTEAEEIAKLTVNTAADRSKSAIDNARHRVGAILQTTEEVHDVSNIQLRELRRETLAIRQAVQEAFNALQEKAEVLDTYIENAQITIEDEKTLVATKKLEEIPNIRLDDIRKAYASRKGNTPIQGTSIVNHKGEISLKENKTIFVSEEPDVPFNMDEFVPEPSKTSISFPFSDGTDQITTFTDEMEDKKEAPPSETDSKASPVLKEEKNNLSKVDAEILPKEKKSLPEKDTSEKPNVHKTIEPIENAETQIPEINEDKKEDNKTVGSESALLSGDNTASFSSAMVRPPKKAPLKDTVEPDSLAIDTTDVEETTTKDDSNKNKSFPPSLNNPNEDKKEENNNPTKGGFF